MGLLNNLKDKFNKAEFTVAPNKKLKTISKEFLDAFDLQLVFYKGSIIADGDMTLAALNKKTTKEVNAKGDDLKIKGSRIIADYTTNGRRETLLIPIPYHKGYTAQVNGKKAILYTALSGFMCVELGAGENHVEIRYETPGLWYGLIISAAGILLLVLAAVWRKLLRRKHMAADGPTAVLERPAGWWYGPAIVLPYLWLAATLLAIYILPMYINLSAK